MKLLSQRIALLLAFLFCSFSAFTANVGDTWEEGTGGGLTFTTRYFFTLKIVSTSPRQCVIEKYSGPTDLGLNWDGDVKFEASYNNGLVSYDVVGISSNAFAGAKIKTIDFSEATNLTHIDSYAFSNCTNLTSISLHASTNLTSIGSYAFSGCSRLTEIYLPYTLTTLGSYAFRNCSSLKSLQGGTGKLNGLNYYTLGALPPYIINIPDGTFYGCSSLDSVMIHKSATSIGNSAFYGCRNLKKLNSYQTTSTTTYSRNPDGFLPLNLEQIGAYAFMNCSALTTLYLPEGLQAIENYTFQNDTLLTHFGKYYLNTATNAFTYTDNWLPESVKSVGAHAFYNTRLPNVSMYDGVTSLGSSAFENCKALTYARLSSELTELPYSVFYGCEKLSFVYNGVNVKTIDTYAFGRCTAMQTLNLANSTYFGKVETVGSNAFRGCTALRGVQLADCTTAIYSYAFYDCPALVLVNLGNGLKTIGEQAFYNCSNLPKIVFPQSITGVYSNAFAGCSAMKVIDATAVADPAVFEVSAFNDDAIKANARLYVPFDSEVDYHNAVATAGITHLIADVANAGLADIVERGTLPDGDFVYHYRVRSADVANYPGVYSTGTTTFAPNTAGVTAPTCPAGLAEFPGILALSNKGYDYDVTNWIAFDNADFAGKTLAAGVTFALTDRANPTLRFDAGFDVADGGVTATNYTPLNNLAVTTSTFAYEPNSYCAATFGTQDEFWFVDPQPCEYASVRWAVYVGNGLFYAAENASNAASQYRLTGAFRVDDSMLQTGDSFTEGVLYDFLGVIKRATASADAPRRSNYTYDDTVVPNDQWLIYPIAITNISEAPVTAVTNIRAGKTVESVRYINPAGMVSATPFSGVNIVVTRHTDGTIATSKQTH